MSSVLHILKIATHFDHLLHPFDQEKGADETGLFKRVLCVALFVLASSKTKKITGVVTVFYLGCAYWKHLKILKNSGPNTEAIDRLPLFLTGLDNSLTNICTSMESSAHPADDGKKEKEAPSVPSVSRLSAVSPVAPPADPYSTLAAPNPTQEKAIRFILETLATTNFASLIWEKSELEKQGKKVFGLNTLKQIEFILNNAELKEWLRQVRKNTVWGNYFSEIRKGLTEMADARKLNSYLPGFYKAVKADPEPLPAYVHKRQWESWIDALLAP